MPPKHKKHSAHPRDRRNENGLAAPGKQIKKRKSDGALNGHAENKQSRTGPHPTDPSVAESVAAGPVFRLDEAVQIDERPRRDMGRNKAKSLAAIGTPAYGVAFRDQYGDSPTSSESLSRTDTHTGNDSYDARYGSPRLGGLPDVPTTVITAWSMLDTIAILLVLMQLPSTVLTLVNVVFAFLTLGSPPTGWSKSSIASASEWLQSHGGNPSILTMALLDLVFLGLWCVAPFGRNLFLAFAQAVVAISLGGCSTIQPGNISALLSVGIVCCQHYLGTEYCRTSLEWLSWTLSLATSRTSIGPVRFEDYLSLLHVTSDNDRSWPRALLELHIVTQGIIRIIRRAFMRQSSTKSVARRQAVDDHNHAATISTEITAEGAQNISTDGRHPGPSPASRDAKEKSVSTGKRRRRQATYVRSQQPFWAAIASTKVTVSREIEQSQASRDAFEAGSEGVEYLGSASNHCIDDSVWVSDVLDTEIWFSALIFLSKAAPGSSAAVESFEDETALASGVSGAIMVRVNGANWGPTSVVSGGLHEGKAVMTGKVFGLGSLTNYRIEFVRARDQAILFSVSLLTRPDAHLEQFTSMNQRSHADKPTDCSTSASRDDALRPMSPTSTLQKSIAAAEVSLADHRSRSKKTKKDHKASTNSLRKEVDLIDSRLSSVGGNDERQRQRQIQYRQNIKQAEESIANTTSELDELGEIPDEERKAAAESKARWLAKSKAHQEAQDELDATKSERNRQAQAVRAENTQQTQKHERLAGRLKKLTAQRDNLVAAQLQETKDQKRRDQTRFSEMVARADVERSYNANISRLEAQRQGVLDQIAQYEHQITLLESNIHSDTGAQPMASYLPSSHPLPHTNTNPISRPFTTAPPPGFASNPQPGYQQHSVGASPVHARRSSLIAKNRGRSSSMLSTVSALADDEIDHHPSSFSHTAAHSINHASHQVPSSSATAAANHAMNGIHRHNGTSVNGFVFSNGISAPAAPVGVVAAATSQQHQPTKPVRHASGGSSGGSSSQPGRPGSRSGAASPKAGVVRLSPIGAEVVGGKGRSPVVKRGASGLKGGR